MRTLVFSKTQIHLKKVLYLVMHELSFLLSFILDEFELDWSIIRASIKSSQSAYYSESVDFDALELLETVANFGTFS